MPRPRHRRTRMLRALAATAVVGLLAPLVPAVPAAADEAGAPRRIVAGWMPYWTTDASLASYEANADVISEISPFWYSTTWSASGGTKVVVNPYANSQISNATNRRAIVARLKAGGAKVIPSVVDATGARRLAAVMADPGTRGTLVGQLVDLAVTEGYDGIDIDYEGFAFNDGRETWSTTRPNWVAFMTELGDALHAQGKLLTVAVPSQCNTSLTDTKCGGTNGYWVYDFLGIAPAVDRIRIMAYDYSWSVPGPIGPYPWAEAIAAYYASQIPSTKVQIGAPTYGRDWVRRKAGSSAYDLSGNCPAAGSSAYNAIVKTNAVDAVDVPDLLARVGNPPVRYDETYQESTFSYDKKVDWNDGGVTRTCTAAHEVWFNGAQSALARTELVGKYNLGGVAFWTIGGEDAAQWAPIRAYAGGMKPATTAVTVSHPATAVYGQPVAVTATVTTSGVPLAGAPATLKWRAFGTRGWTTVGTVTTGADGIAAFSATPKGSGTWKVGVARTEISKAVQSGPVGDTRLRPAVTAVLPAGPAAPGTEIPLRGKVAPATAAQKVRVQVQEGTAWRTVTRATTTSTGRVRTRITTGTTPGAYSYRVVANKTTTLLTGASAPVPLTVG